MVNIKFRRIIEVYEQVDEETNAVTYFYSTGDVEGNRDEYTDSEGATRIAYISSDYVIGIYSQTGGFLIYTVKIFCSSSFSLIKEEKSSGDCSLSSDFCKSTI